MHDDMFGPVQSMQEALEDFNTVKNDEPRLILYPFVQYIIFYICEFFKIFDPQSKMYVVRIVHSLYSILTVYLSYKITLLISNKKNANQVGIIVALFWILPYMSVRNLVEVFSIPPLMAGVYYIIQTLNREKNKILNSKEKMLSNNILIIIAGIFFSLAFVIRYQTAFIPFGIGIVFLFNKKFKEFGLLTISILILSSLLLVIPEYLIWNKTFYHITNYILNSTNFAGYPVSPWYNIPLLLIGILIPPFGIILFYSFFKTWKKYAILFIPTLCFIIFHTIYPNKQERFILTIVPLFIILCITGWNEFVKKSKFWRNHQYLIKFNWIWFWIINIILLTIFTFTYSKKTRVEAFTYLSKQNVNAIVIEMNETDTYFAPIFYLGNNKNKPIYYLYKGYMPKELINNVSLNFNTNPNYAIFFDNKELKKRINNFEKNFQCQLQLNTKIIPGLLDRILYCTNPKHNKNYTAYIFKININK